MSAPTSTITGPYLSLDLAADYLFTTRRNLEKRIARGDLAAFKLGRKTLVRREDLDRLLAPKEGEVVN